LNNNNVSFVRKSRSEFRNYYMLENLKNLRTLALIFWGLNLIFRLLLSVVPSGVTKAQNFPEFNVSNWINLIAAPLMWLSADLLYKSLQKNGVTTFTMRILVVLSAIFLVLTGMISSFIVTYIPSDNLITFMVALIVVGVVFTFEMPGTWVISLITFAAFSGLLFTLSHSSTEILYNELIGLVLLAGFTFVSRANFNYKAKHFLQLVEINQNKIEIENASNFKNEVLGMVAHDLRNPIAAVESLAMLMEMGNTDKDTLENLDMMKQSCAKARAIINDLIEVARNDSAASFEVQRCDMDNILHDIASTWDNIAGMRGRVKYVNHTHDAFAYINIEKFQRVVDNLITNAAKFSPDLEKIDVTLNKADKELIIEVRDHGVGIPAKILPQIFDRFTKAGRTGLRGEHSTGLGLSIVKQIIEKHNGTIAVTSTEGHGSTFTIHLPAVV
jgi:two-component system, OmpR family, sensor histidine kinase VicK